MIPDDVEVAWKPNPGQQEFALGRQEREIFYGGARGGGKTDMAIVFPSRWFGNPLLRFLVIRRNSGDLRDWIDRAKRLWNVTGAEWVAREVRFPSGAKGFFGHLHDNDAYERYQGHEYQKMIIEELTHIPTLELYLKLTSSCRSTVDGLIPQVVSTANPGNIGHKWVRERFIDVGPVNQTYFDAKGNSRIFVPAKIEDNPVLTSKDPHYVAWLDSLPEPLRKAWREGSWESFEVRGAYYSKWIDAAREAKHITNVPHDDAAPVHTWWDIGVGDATTIGFFQEIGRNEWHLIDYYENEGEGLQHYIKVLEDKKAKLNYNYGKHYAPHDIEVREFTRDGKTRREIAKSFGIDFEIVPNLGVEEGIEAVRTRFGNLWIDAARCTAFLERISQYRKEFDEKNNVYKDKPVHDWTSHAADMLRYWAVTPSKTSATSVKIHS